MSRIIALQGRGESGKSTTISLLPNILIANGYKQLHGHYKKMGNDYIDIYENGPIRVGLSSAGDNYNLVFDRLHNLIKKGCTVCICACRTYDRIPPGSVTAVRSYRAPIHSHQFQRKTYPSSSITWTAANALDANALFLLI